MMAQCVRLPQWQPTRRKQLSYIIYICKAIIVVTFSSTHLARVRPVKASCFV